MTRAADLEIGIHRRDGQTYAVEIRLLPPGADEEVRPDSGSMQLDLDALRGESADDKYGELLGGALLMDDKVREAFANARAVADAADADLRVRLLFGPTAIELHTLRWEAARDPQKKNTLFTGEKLLFSRYVSSNDWRPLRPKAALRALAFIANPSDVAKYSLAPVRVADELAGINTAFGSAVETRAEGGRATLSALLAALREGFDVLYLVAHGRLIKGEPKIYLEKEDGSSDVVAGTDLVARLSELRVRPRLIVLGSCQSAGTADQQIAEGYMTALGPRLAESGIPAVVAMQGTVSMDTEAMFMASFFRELQRVGVVDLAMSVARTETLIAKRPDWWMPVLFMRLKSGLIWYTPGFGEAHQLEKWPSLINELKKGRCTPILGHGLTDSLLRPRRELAQKWADSYHFPMAPYDREDLPQVAQYLAVKQNLSFPRDMLISDLQNWLLQQYRANLPQASQFEGSATGEGLDQLISAIGARRRESDPNDPFRILATVPVPVYITASPHHLLFDALKAAGKQPREEFCRWNRQLEGLPSLKEREPNYTPDPQTPLIYYIFGRLNEIKSLVLTEDDYFDFLIGATKNSELIPEDVRSKLANSGLLFLGFQLQDWDFRVLVRRIVDQEGGNLRRRYTNVAVQIDPEEGRIMEPEGARRYLESYFDILDISIYWGTADDFAADLLQQIAKPDA